MADLWGIDRVPVYVNKKSRVGHLDRLCDYLSMVPDGAIYVRHPSVSEPVRQRMCRFCSPTYLHPIIEFHDPGLTAGSQDGTALSIGEAERS